ncbi:hypothetical protein [Pseudomonas rhodesiae]|uniref:hypothetical protein n=1 Tax=Pseudomonas rhodesiae TaxID=76760 RepID=UPI0024202085|nr:hypothetical protein [Pseudomonas rhodesiae]
MADWLNNLRQVAPGPNLSTGSGHAHCAVAERAQGTSLPPQESQLLDSRFRSNGQEHFDARDSYSGGSQVGNPYARSDDQVLATQLNNVFPMLGDFKKNGRLTLGSLEAIAKEDPKESKALERTIMLAREILSRPRLADAIVAKGGEITSASLEKVASYATGNTHPNTQSADPFHSKTDAQVVQAFRGMFDDLRDPSQDSNFFFEKHRYVKKDKLIEMSKDPDETDKHGQLVRDAATGFPKKKYSELQVYMAKNLVERPGLLASLDSTKANGTNLFGSHNNGSLKNYSIDRWLKNDKEEKGR